MIGHGHIDPALAVAGRLSRGKSHFPIGLGSDERVPEFKFIGSSAALYEWIEENDPAMFEKLRSGFKKAAGPLWGLVGRATGQYPSGESYVRHALYGQRYFQAKFGRKLLWALTRIASATTGCSPDPEEKRFGLLCIMRPQPNERAFPAGCSGGKPLMVPGSCASASPMSI